MATYCFDIDGTICQTTNKKYSEALPYSNMILSINRLYDEGNYIKLYTARGMGQFKGNVGQVYDTYYDLTKKQMDEWGIKYHELILGKPSYDYIIDDKSMTPEYFLLKTTPKYKILYRMVKLIFHLIHKLKLNAEIH